MTLVPLRLALTPVAGVPPKSTETGAVSPVPTMVTLVPPEEGPVAGATEEMTGPVTVQVKVV